MRRSVLFIMILTIFLTPFFKASAKPTRNEFYTSMIEHKGRVADNAGKIIKHYPHLFPKLMSMPVHAREHFLTIYLHTHDYPKFMDLEQLKSLGYKGEKTIFEKLYENWGKDLKRRPPFITELNQLEDVYKDLVIKKHFSHMNKEFLNQILQEVKYAEFVADETDAKINRGPELGVDTKPFDAEARLRDFFKDRVGAEISRWLELSIYNRSKLIFCETHFSQVGP